MSSSWHLRRAAASIRRGGIVAYPTEAVYGLGCDPGNPAALQRLIAAKGRDAAKGLILIAAELGQLEPFVTPLTDTQRERVDATWPGPVTWIMPARPEVPAPVTGGRDTIAVRVSAHPLAAALCRSAGGPLVSTSANRAGRPPARSPLQVRLTFGDELDYIIHGPLGGLRRPTEIRDLTSGKVLRAG